MTCIDSIYKTNQSKDTDKLIVGDSFGNIMTFVNFLDINFNWSRRSKLISHLILYYKIININELSSNNTKPDIIDPTKTVVQLDNVKNEFVKKKFFDEAVTKVVRLSLAILWQNFIIGSYFFYWT